MKFILAKKVGMTQLYNEKGKVVPVTVVEVEPNVVVDVKTIERDGYEAVQIGTGTSKKLSKAVKGHIKGLGSFRFLREFRTTTLNDQTLKTGDTFDLTIFELGEKVKVTGFSKGKGFAGAMKRHGFSGMPMGHGHKHVARHIGSIGQRFPQHTLKGKRMAGRMGNEQVTVRGSAIVTVDTEHKLIGLKGPIPGNVGSLVKIVSI